MWELNYKKQALNYLHSSLSLGSKMMYRDITHDICVFYLLP
jgi:hypothetical protein